MKVFRIKHVINALSLFTAAIFLNMSFILAEISTLRIDRDKEMARNLSILVANSIAEEEPGGSADEDSSVNEIDFIFNHPPNASTGITLNKAIKFSIWSHGQPLLAEYEICSPPPEA